MEDCEISEVSSDVTSDIQLESASEDNSQMPERMFVPISSGEPIHNEKDLDYMPTELSEEDEKNCTSGLPRVNCVEKIIICFDLNSEMDKENFRSRSGDKFTQLEIIVKALRLFINSKSKLNGDHEYALVLLEDTATWMKDFTNNSREILTLLSDLRCSNTPDSELETFDMSSLFNIIEEKVTLPTVDDPIIPPSYIIRILFIYGRSNCLIQTSKSESRRILESSPYVFFDSLYVHDPLSEDNQCEEVFNRLCKLDTRGFSYIFEVAKNPTKLYVYMAQLIAHPLQRVPQQSAAYKLRPLTPDLEKGIPNLPS